MKVKSARYTLDQGPTLTMVMRCLTSTLLLLCAAMSPIAAQEDVVRFQSQVSRSQDFREPIGHGLVLILDSTGDGWEIKVAPKTAAEPECIDFTWIVNFPIHAYNSLHLNPSYGITAREAVGMSPREFDFVLNCEGYKRESTFLGRFTGSLAASEKQQAEAGQKLASSP